jgi:prolyl oligopeptidase
LEVNDDGEYLPIGNQGPTLFVRSDKGAPNRAVLATPLNGKPAVWKTIVPEAKESIESVALIGGRLVAQYLVDVQSRLTMFGLDGGRLGDIQLPGAGTVYRLSGRADTPTVWYSFTSPLVPSTVYAFDPASGKSSPFEAPAAPVDVSLYETRALFATSKDGTRVPMFVTLKKGLPLDSSNPTMVYGYGGFSATSLPSYRPDVPAWLERGGVWATVNMRGGAE